MANNNLIKYILEGRLFREIRRKLSCEHYRFKLRKISNQEERNKRFLILRFKNSFGYYPNLDKPETFNEKILWTKLHWRNDLAYNCADKIQFKDYLKDNGLENSAAKILKVYDSPTEFLNDLNNLPEECVIKTNHNSGSVFIKTKKTSLKALNKGAKFIVKGFNKGNFAKGDEWVYEKIEPKIFVEEKINSKGSLCDYKFFCFNGEPKYCFVASDRDHICVKFDYFDMDWNWLDVKNVHKHAKIKPQKPESFKEMIQICRKLSKPFSHVRVDLYESNGKVYVGELTFFHFGGNEKFKPNSFDKTLGSCWDLSKINKEEII